MRNPRRSLIILAGSAALMLIGGCANPFVTSYSGRRQTSEIEPVRVQRPIESRRLGISRFDIDANATGLPGDEDAKAAAVEFGAAAYFWRRQPKFNAGNTSNSFAETGASAGGTKFNTQSYDDKLIRWYSFEAIFYADPPPSDRDD